MLGKNVAVNELKGSDKVSSLKERLFKTTGIQMERQRLLYGGRQLENDKTMADYKISKGATVHMVVRCKGGD